MGEHHNNQSGTEVIDVAASKLVRVKHYIYGIASFPGLPTILVAASGNTIKGEPKEILFWVYLYTGHTEDYPTTC